MMQTSQSYFASAALSHTPNIDDDTLSEILHIYCHHLFRRWPRHYLLQWLHIFIPAFTTSLRLIGATTKAGQNVRDAGLSIPICSPAEVRWPRNSVSISPIPLLATYCHLRASCHDTSLPFIRATLASEAVPAHSKNSFPFSYASINNRRCIEPRVSQRLPRHMISRASAKLSRHNMPYYAFHDSLIFIATPFFSPGYSCR